MQVGTITPEHDFRHDDTELRPVVLLDLRVEWAKPDWTLSRTVMEIADGDVREIMVSEPCGPSLPLRHRNATPDGEVQLARIAYTPVVVRRGDLKGWGFAEYLDQMVDGVPVGAA
jgi:hypothetical protein